jgi:hypothetical protein
MTRDELILACRDAFLVYDAKWHLENDRETDPEIYKEGLDEDYFMTQYASIQSDVAFDAGLDRVATVYYPVTDELNSISFIIAYDDSPTLIVACVDCSYSVIYDRQALTGEANG